MEKLHIWTEAHGLDEYKTDMLHHVVTWDVDVWKSGEVVTDKASKSFQRQFLYIHVSRHMMQELLEGAVLPVLM